MTSTGDNLKTETKTLRFSAIGDTYTYAPTEDKVNYRYLGDGEKKNVFFILTGRERYEILKKRECRKIIRVNIFYSSDFCCFGNGMADENKLNILKGWIEKFKENFKNTNVLLMITNNIK